MTDQIFAPDADFRMGQGLALLYATRQLVEPVPGLIQRIVSLRSLLAPEVRYIDLSHWNHKPDWKKLRDVDGIKVIWFRSTFGPEGKDNVFPIWAPEAIDEGFEIKNYHFSRQNFSGVTQANNCFDAIEPIASMLGYFPVVIWDVETVDGVSNSVRWVRQFEFYDRMQVLGAKKEKLGPYTSPGFANTYLTPVDPRVNDHPQVIAHWWDGLPTPPTGWTNVVAQQRGIYNDHSWIAPVQGIEPDVDVDFFFGDEAAFRTFLGATPEPVPDPCFSKKVATLRQTQVFKSPGLNSQVLGLLPAGTVFWIESIYVDQKTGRVWIRHTAFENLVGWSPVAVGEIVYLGT